MFQTIVTLLDNVLDAHTTGLFLFDETRQQLILIASQSTSKHLQDRISLPLDKSGILAHVQKMGHSIHMSKVELEDIKGPLPFYRDNEEGIKGVFIVPVEKGKGLLYADTKRSWGFNDKQQKWILETAQVLGNLLRHQERLARGKDYSRIIKFWHKLEEALVGQQNIKGLCQSFVTLGVDFIGAEYGLIALHSRDERHYTLLASTSNLPASYLNRTFSIDKGLVGRLFSSRKPLFVQELNPELADHRILSTIERIPHTGTFWGIYGSVSSMTDLAFAVISRDRINRSLGDWEVLAKGYRFLLLAYEKIHWQERSNSLDFKDSDTGLLNAPGFEKELEGLLTSSIQRSDPFTMVIVQFEPWQLCYSRVTLSEVRRWYQSVGEELRKKLPEDAVIGCLAENRFGILFPKRLERDAARCCKGIKIFTSPLEVARRHGILVRAYCGWAVFPQNGTTSEQLWKTAYWNLWQDFHRLKKPRV